MVPCLFLLFFQIIIPHVQTDCYRIRYFSHTSDNQNCIHNIIEMTNDINITLASLETELEASNTALRQILSSKNSHIAMLEERLLNMSFELASSRTREDEQNLIIRRSSTRMTEDNISDSARSLALLSSTGAGGIIDNMTTKFDRIERSEHLRVDFPMGRRGSTMMMDEYSAAEAAAAAMNSAAPRQRRTVVGRLFRSRISCSLPGDAAAAVFEQDERDGAHRKPKKNPKLLHDDDCSTRLIGSTIFPREDDNYLLGFE